MLKQVYIECWEQACSEHGCSEHAESPTMNMCVANTRKLRAYSTCSQHASMFGTCEFDPNTLTMNVRKLYTACSRVWKHDSEHGFIPPAIETIIRGFAGGY